MAALAFISALILLPSALILLPFLTKLFHAHHPMTVVFATSSGPHESHTSNNFPSALDPLSSTSRLNAPNPRQAAGRLHDDHGGNGDDNRSNYDNGGGGVRWYIKFNRQCFILCAMGKCRVLRLMLPNNYGDQVEIFGIAESFEWCTEQCGVSRSPNYPANLNQP